MDFSFYNKIRQFVFHILITDQKFWKYPPLGVGENLNIVRSAMRLRDFTILGSSLTLFQVNLGFKFGFSIAIIVDLKTSYLNYILVVSGTGNMNSSCSLSCKIARGNFQCPVLPAARGTEVPTTFNIFLVLRSPLTLLHCFPWNHLEIPMELILAPLVLDYKFHLRICG